MADVRSVRRILIARAGRRIRQNQNGASPPLLPAPPYAIFAAAAN